MSLNHIVIALGNKENIKQYKEYGHFTLCSLFPTISLEVDFYYLYKRSTNCGRWCFFFPIY